MLIERGQINQSLVHYNDSDVALYFSIAGIQQ